MHKEAELNQRTSTLNAKNRESTSVRSNYDNENAGIVSL